MCTEEPQAEAARTMIEMRRVLEHGEAPGPRWVPVKWRAWGYHPVCSRDEDIGAAGEQVALRVG